jgi:predicted O-linked N-acetylglucosamine transferase (SPINDLY family)
VELSRIYQQAVEHHRAGRLGEAAVRYRQILKHAPQSPEVLVLLASILEDTGRAVEAAEIYRQIVMLRPADPDGYVGLGNCLRQLGDLDGAIGAYRRAIDHRPDYVGALNNLANALWDSGNLEEAIPLLRTASAVGTDPAAASNLVYSLHFDPSVSPRELRAEHDLWNQRFARPLFTRMDHGNARDPNRRLRIGYVSPDFHNHPVALFMLPLLEHHDRSGFEITCYSDAFPDGITHRLASLAQRWRDTRVLSDEQLTQQICADQIDILVDLALHSRGSRLLTFARKPAPVQVTYLGYCSTTGLDTMDYRLSDPYLDPPSPPGSDLSIYSEVTVRLPATYWCYRPIFDVPAPQPPPALSQGFVTFGCLNNFYKIRPRVLDAWMKLVRELPDSRLILHAHAGAHRERVSSRFKAAGVDPGRVEFVGGQSLVGYFETYRRIDVALDPFPFPGATTTLDALWSGVPVVTLAGSSAVSRAGVSILSNLGLTELIATSVDQYVEIARSLTVDLQRLMDLRATLRDRMKSSPLTDATRFVQDLENVFREMWRRWRASR